MRILHAIHDYLPRHRAGSELYVQALCRAQQTRHHVRVLCAEYDAARPHGSLAERSVDGVGVTEVVNNWPFATLADAWRAPDLQPAFEDVLAGFRPDVLHVHNLLNLSFALPRLARERGVVVVGTLHDYTLFCPSGGQRVHVAEGHVCHEIDVARCARCFADTPWWTRMATQAGGGGRLRRLVRRVVAGSARARRPTSEDIEQRLMAARRVLEEFDLLVAPSPSLAEEYRRLGAPVDRLRVSDYGFPTPPPSPRGERGELLRIGFVGTPIWHKGVHVLLEAVTLLPAGRWTLDVWGDPDVAPRYSRSLRRRAAGRPVRFRGGFDSGQVADVYAGMDVLVVPSLWLENSPLVVHEAFLAGVPVVAARMGGLADLVSHDVNGLLYEATSADDLARALRRLIDEPDLLERLAAHAPVVKTIEQDGEEWDVAYAEALAWRREARR